MQEMAVLIGFFCGVQFSRWYIAQRDLKKTLKEINGYWLAWSEIGFTRPQKFSKKTEYQMNTSSAIKDEQACKGSARALDGSHQDTPSFFGFISSKSIAAMRFSQMRDPNGYKCWLLLVYLMFALATSAVTTCDTVRLMMWLWPVTVLGGVLFNRVDRFLPGYLSGQPNSPTSPAIVFFSAFVGFLVTAKLYYNLLFGTSPPGFIAQAWLIDVVGCYLISAILFSTNDQGLGLLAFENVWLSVFDHMCIPIQALQFPLGPSMPRTSPRKRNVAIYAALGASALFAWTLLCAAPWWQTHCFIDGLYDDSTAWGSYGFWCINVLYSLTILRIWQEWFLETDKLVVNFLSIVVMLLTFCNVTAGLACYGIGRELLLRGYSRGNEKRKL
jgi:hypothetical protein